MIGDRDDIIIQTPVWSLKPRHLKQTRPQHEIPRSFLPFHHHLLPQ
jgi:hypothetical protein